MGKFKDFLVPNCKEEEDGSIVCFTKRKVGDQEFTSERPVKFIKGADGKPHLVDDGGLPKPAIEELEKYIRGKKN